MPITKVSLTTAELANQFADFLTGGGNLQPLENAVTTTLNNAPNNMGVIATDAQIDMGGKVVKFEFNAPNMLDVAAVKAALR